MKSIIIRKPKFMRSDAAMVAYVRCANACGKSLDTQDNLTLDEKYELARKIGECINKAAKAGGFLRTKDFIKWMNEYETT